MKNINILIPTYNRAEALAVTLTGLCYQTYKDFDVIIADQSDEYILSMSTPLHTAIRLLESKGHSVQLIRNLPRKGMAHQRQFLLDNSKAPYSLFLDDDLILESYVVEIMHRTLKEEECGFVGCAVIGLSYKDDVRPNQQHIEFWETKVIPEVVVPGSKEWKRYELHNAANILHVQDNYQIVPSYPKCYKIAWVGGCVMYDTQKLLDVGGFDFWKQLPENHCGEDVLAQLRVMKKHGGCGVLLSGVYHQELTTTVPDRKVNAPEYLEI
ncbi:MAG TPA: glycosyltransferase family A protein [Cytophagaceae bacterium]